MAKHRSTKLGPSSPRRFSTILLLLAMAKTDPQAHRKAATLTDLPTELKAIIVKLRRSQASLDSPNTHGGWRTVIRDLCLVSADLVPLCQEELFHSIRMEPEDCKFGQPVPGASDTLSLFPKLAESSPHLCKFVKQLSITIPNQVLSNDLATRIASTLRLMTNITQLGIEQDPRGRIGPLRSESLVEVARGVGLSGMVDALRGILKSEGLTHLMLKGIVVSPQDLMECIGLKHVYLMDSNLCFERGAQ